MVGGVSWELLLFFHSQIISFLLFFESFRDLQIIINYFYPKNGASGQEGGAVRRSVIT